MKSVIRKNEMVIKWEIAQGDHTLENFVVDLDNGNNAPCKVEFDRNKYDFEEVIEMSLELAEMLGVEFNRESFKVNKGQFN
ncbi:hypothetical protein [Clostridium botulinum]|nr:hypothetical protein [Clostridium botulinum]UZP07823.1 hypothetical protein JYA71_05505 [Clostridium botulinum]